VYKRPSLAGCSPLIPYNWGGAAKSKGCKGEGVEAVHSVRAFAVQGLEKLRLRDVRHTSQEDMDALLSSLTNLTFLELKRSPPTISQSDSDVMQLPTLIHLSCMIKLQVTQKGGYRFPSARHPSWKVYLQCHGFKYNGCNS
jgi:hypothetical protein